MRPFRKHRSGLTLIELLAVIVVIALIIVVLFPSNMDDRELSNRVVCAANIRGIVQCMSVYANSNDGLFPCTPGPIDNRYINTPTAPISYAGNSPARKVLHDWFGGAKIKATPHVGSPTGCLWLMVLQDYVTPKSFICPSDPIATTPSQQYVTVGGMAAGYQPNFGVMSGAARPGAATNSTGLGLSYSINYPWEISGGKTPAHAGPWWTNKIGNNQPVMSDMAPEDTNNPKSPPAGRDTSAPLDNTYGPYVYNSGNHAGDGQNVGFGDDHVTWESNPYVGEDNDNIFTYLNATSTRSQKSDSAIQGTIRLCHSSRRTGTSGVVNTASLAGWVQHDGPPYDTLMVPVRNVNTGAW